MLTKTIDSSRTLQVSARCHATQADEAEPDGHKVRMVFQRARDTTMAPPLGWDDERFACSPPAGGGSPRRAPAGRSAPAGTEGRHGAEVEVLLYAAGQFRVEGAAIVRLAPLPPCHTAAPPSRSLVPPSPDRGPLVWRSGGRVGAAHRA